MRRVILAVVFVVVLLSGVGLAAFPRSPPSPAPSFPCIASSREGWLTLTSNRALLEIEGGPGRGRVGVGPATRTERWVELSEADARARAVALLAPTSAPERVEGAGQVSMFIQCDGAGHYWHGDVDDAPPAYTQCLRPRRHQTPLDCVKAVHMARGRPRNEPAEALAARLDDAAFALGQSLPPPVTSSPWPAIPALPSGPGALSDWFEDEEPDGDVEVAD